MLNFIRRWYFNRHRYIYTYWNGHRIAKADPMVIWRDLQAHEEYRQDDFKLMKVPELRNEIIGKLAKVVRGVFNVAGPDSGGLTELECLDVLTEYITYTGFQKKNGDKMQSWLSPTDMEVFVDSTDTPNMPEGLGSILTPIELTPGSLNQSLPASL